MNAKRPERVADLLLEFVSQLLRREINDPRIGVVTLTRSEISRDLKHARIYFSVLSGQEAKDEVLAGLKSATGFIRARIGKELKLRFVPTVDFVYDKAGDEAQRIEQLLRQVKDEEC
jgi:ribosome-binding factor A